MQHYFELPSLLIAERRGRALIEIYPPEPGQEWHLLTESSPEGAATLAAARLAHNCGGKVTIHLLAADAASNSDFATLLEVVGCMDLPVNILQQEKIHHLPETARLVLGCAVPASFELPDGVIRMDKIDSNQAWTIRKAALQPETMLHSATPDMHPLSCTQVRAIDASAIDDYGLPGLCLMENAGIGATAVAVDILEEDTSRKTVVIVGKGNNGGDGLVVARGLAEMGYPVEVAFICDPEKLHGDAGSNYEIIKTSGLPTYNLAEEPERLASLLEDAYLAVDGILGTGISGAVRGPALAAIEAINNSQAQVLALDIPSGLNADSGEVCGTAITAGQTVTFAAIKRGLLCAEGPTHIGLLTLADIGAPAELLT